MLLRRNAGSRKSIKKSDISKPTHFEHRIHADFDPQTGDIRGLPIQWQTLLSVNFLRKNRIRPIYGENCGQNQNDLQQITRSATYVGNPPRSLATFNSRSQSTEIFAKNIQKPNILDNALVAIVNPIDPRSHLSEFIKIGSGFTSTVFSSHLISHRRKVAVKCIDVWRQPRRELLLNEALMVRELPRHPHIVECLSSHLVGDELWIIMEFMDGGSLTNVIEHERLEEPIIATVSRQCLDALEFLHTRGVVHRDIKSDSILFTGDGTAKLSDFGFSTRLTKECPRRKSLLGTPYWLSSQVAAKESYGTDADIWSFGITIIEMIFGEPPYFKDSPETAMQKIIELPAVTLPAAANASPELESFVSRMLVKAVNSRATAAELLQHPFLYKAKHPRTILPILQEVQQKKNEKIIH